MIAILKFTQHNKKLCIVFICTEVIQSLVKYHHECQAWSSQYQMPYNIFFEEFLFLYSFFFPLCILLPFWSYQCKTILSAYWLWNVISGVGSNFILRIVFNFSELCTVHWLDQNNSGRIKQYLNTLQVHLLYRCFPRSSWMKIGRTH